MRGFLFMKLQQNVSVFWLRRDLRLSDNAGLYHALKSGNPVLPIFIFDKTILSILEDKTDRRVDFIHQILAALKSELKKIGSDLLVIHGKPKTVFEKLLSEYKIQSVFTNHDYEPYAKQRDLELADIFSSARDRKSVV